ncbi:hypothetical protein KDA11_02885 [Candidatus Saccharibacteria bacterium]|nr:hypothetical protein [Candidatus Saccharibacteria bacterium]
MSEQLSLNEQSINSPEVNNLPVNSDAFSSVVNVGKLVLSDASLGPDPVKKPKTEHNTLPKFS